MAITAAQMGPDYLQADLRLDGVDHSGASHELRVFFNNPSASGATDRTADNGYAASFYVFGHGGCVGDDGHCEVRTKRSAFDRRPPHPLTPASMWITVTDAVRRAAASSDQLVITIVAVFRTDPDPDATLSFDRVTLVTHG